MPIPTKSSRYQIWAEEGSDQVIGYIPQTGDRYSMTMLGVIITAACLGAERVGHRDWKMVDRPMLLEKPNPDCKGA